MDVRARLVGNEETAGVETGRLEEEALQVILCKMGGSTGEGSQKAEEGKERVDPEEDKEVVDVE